MWCSISDPRFASRRIQSVRSFTRIGRRGIGGVGVRRSRNKFRQLARRDTAATVRTIRQWPSVRSRTHSTCRSWCRRRQGVRETQIRPRDLSFLAKRSVVMAGRHRRTKRARTRRSALDRGAAIERLEGRQLLSGVPAILDPSFETPVQGTGSSAYAYGPLGAAWSFLGNSGVQANGSAWGAPTAADGAQTAFLQSAVPAKSAATDRSARCSTSPRPAASSCNFRLPSVVPIRRSRAWAFFWTARC